MLSDVFIPANKGTVSMFLSGSVGINNFLTDTHYLLVFLRKYHNFALHFIYLRPDVLLVVTNGLFGFLNRKDSVNHRFFLPQVIIVTSNKAVSLLNRPRLSVPGVVVVCAQLGDEVARLINGSSFFAANAHGVAVIVCRHISGVVVNSLEENFVAVTSNHVAALRLKARSESGTNAVDRESGVSHRVLGSETPVIGHPFCLSKSQLANRAAELLMRICNGSISAPKTPFCATVAAGILDLVTPMAAAAARSTSYGIAVSLAAKASSA
mmetsp:Transcript_34353/g.88808  ORF Transcript_34353/g.88808 Transcript_34353/m.88808 type:complete len:267 (-) Transcript_34353:219-1019(-)